VLLLPLPTRFANLLAGLLGVEAIAAERNETLVAGRLLVGFIVIPNDLLQGNPLHGFKPTEARPKANLPTFQPRAGAGGKLTMLLDLLLQVFQVILPGGLAIVGVDHIIYHI